MAIYAGDACDVASALLENLTCLGVAGSVGDNLRNTQTSQALNQGTRNAVSSNLRTWVPRSMCYQLLY